ncbi:MAG: KH domain-containing protein, partial [Gammaproteobacteria bacterium]|nr:KH domain-containing protein [Gammaproteobacteria bacterium]
EPFFPDDQLTDRSVRFLSAEIIREKLVRELGEELPYQTTVDIESFKEEGDLTRVHAVVLVETKGQKSIVIGSKGERLKSMSTNARHDIEEMLGNKVFLRVWVKVRKGWSDDERALSSLGFTDLD